MKLFQPIIKKDNNLNIFEFFHLILKNYIFIFLYLLITTSFFYFYISQDFEKVVSSNKYYNYKFTNNVSNMSQYDSIKFNFVIDRIVELQENISMKMMSTSSPDIFYRGSNNGAPIVALFNSENIIAESAIILSSRTFQNLSLPKSIINKIEIIIKKAPNDQKGLNQVQMIYRSENSLSEEEIDKYRKIFDEFILMHISELRNSIQLGIEQVIIQLKWKIEKNLIMANKILNETDSDQLNTINTFKQVIQMFNQYRDNYIPTLFDLIQEYSILDVAFNPLVYDDQVTTIGVVKIETDLNRLKLYQKISSGKLIFFFILFNLLIVILLVVFINSYYAYLYNDKNKNE